MVVFLLYPQGLDTGEHFQSPQGGCVISENFRGRLWDELRRPGSGFGSISHSGAGANDCSLLGWHWGNCQWRRVPCGGGWRCYHHVPFSTRVLRYVVPETVTEKRLARERRMKEMGILVNF